MKHDSAFLSNTSVFRTLVLLNIVAALYHKL